MIYVIGLGPGHPDYMLPAAVKRIREADLVIGAARNLEAIQELCKETMNLCKGFEVLGKYLKDNCMASIAVVVSGDTGFYSMLAFVKRHVQAEMIEVIPGISSLQYMYSRLKKGYENDKWVSLHGREEDLGALILSRTPIGILTDRQHNNRTIAERLESHGVLDAVFYVGERLSYSDEKISRLSVEESKSFVAHDLSVVVIDYE